MKSRCRGLFAVPRTLSPTLLGPLSNNDVTGGDTMLLYHTIGQREPRC